MVRIPFVLTLLPVLVVGVLAEGPEEAPQRQAPSASHAAPVSPDRVSEGLKRPELEIPPLPDQPPMFHVDVTGKLETPLDAVRRELREAVGLPPWKIGPPTDPATHASPTLADVDVLPALVSLVAKFKAIRREHAEAEARRMVQQELAAFCTSHDCSQVVQEPLEGVILPK